MKCKTPVSIWSPSLSVPLQAKYDDIKKVVKAAAEGPLKGILGYTEDQVQNRVILMALLY